MNYYDERFNELTEWLNKFPTEIDENKKTLKCLKANCEEQIRQVTEIKTINDIM